LNISFPWAIPGYIGLQALPHSVRPKVAGGTQCVAGFAQPAHAGNDHRSNLLCFGHRNRQWFAAVLGQMALEAPTGSDFDFGLLYLMTVVRSADNAV
jgi:hypothetical protein